MKVLIPLFLVFASEVIYRMPLLEFSKKMVPKIQTSFDDFPLLEPFLNGLASPISSQITYIVFFILTINMMDKLSAMYIWSVSFGVYFIIHILKSLYSEMRLYLQDDTEVKSTACPTGFGNPGGAITLLTFFTVVLTLDYFDPNTNNFFNKKSTGNNRKIKLHMMIILSLLVSGPFALAQVAIGSNSYNEVIFGWSLGFTLGHISEEWIKPIFLNM